MSPWIRRTLGPATFALLAGSLAQAQVGQGAPLDPSKSDDPQIFCQGFAKRSVTIDGVKTERYDIPQPKYLRCVPPQPKAPWVVLKEAWGPEDEQNWQNFIHSLGQSKCNTVDSCLVSSANPYRDQSDIDAVHYSDCADFPMYLRAYFSYKNHLPFSMVTSFEVNTLSPEQQQRVEKKRLEEEAKGNLAAFEASLNDNRYSPNGNHPLGRTYVPTVRGNQRDFFGMAGVLRDAVSSGTYRMFNTDSDVLPDHYSPAVSKDSIKPGTVLYKVTGHLSLVYEVAPDGEIKFIDAHPDNTVSRGSFNKEYPRSTPFQGGGFRNWRPFKVVGIEVDPYTGQDTAPRRNRDGAIVAGKFKYAADSEISDYSAEQYYGSRPAADWDWRKGKFVIGGRDINFFDYVKIRLANGTFKLSPTFQLKKDLNALCVDLQERTRSVQIAIDDKLQQKDHPANLPLNIYGADGEWESYSTPGRDLRIRNRALDIVENAKEYMGKWKAQDPYFDYQGQNLKKDMIEIYNDADATCRISYVNSAGREVRMSLSTALNRVTRLSFDPYFCPELRWGARTDAEMKSCAQSVDKAEWYQFTQFLRNQTVRDPTEVMGYSLGDVKRITQQQAQDAKPSTSRFNIQRALKAL